MQNAIEINNLSKKYDGFTLENVSFNVPQGSIMGFIGENGAGKSTTIKLLLDLISKDGGNVIFLGAKSTELSRENIGVVIDECTFPENLRCKDINAVLKKIYKTWNEEKFSKLIKHFSLPTDKKIKDFSKGMKMKLSIVTALSHDSKILILDEPTSGLDPIVRDEMLDIFLDFIQDESHSILISSHIISDLEKICDYITFIHKGKIVFSENKDLLIEKYGILKCSESDFEKINKKAVKAFRKNSFCIEALVEKKAINGGFVVDNATMENIMLYLIKGERV